MTDGSEHSSETEAVHQQASNQAMADLTCIRPPRIPDDYDSGHDQHDESQPHGQKSQRLDIRQAKAGADESGAPQKHEQGRRCRNRQSSEAHEISARMGLDKSGGPRGYTIFFAGCG